MAAEKLPAFMEWLALRSDLDSLAGQQHAITMMTIHSAKGLEFPMVFVTGMEEGIFPHTTFGDSDPAKLEEERRLAYVAITRARKKLYLTHAATRRTYGSVQTNPPSRFLQEIPEADCTRVGVGSMGFGGIHNAKRGDRHGTFGSGTEAYGGHVFGQRTRSTGGVPRSASASAAAGAFGSRRASGLPPIAPHARKASDVAAPAAAPRAAAASDGFAKGDHVAHKTFGPGVVIGVSGDTIEVKFTRTGKTKKLLKGFAPIVKVS